MCLFLLRQTWYLSQFCFLDNKLILGYQHCDCFCFRCAAYPPLPPNCKEITDPYQPCCKKPYCSPSYSTITPFPEWLSTHAPTTYAKPGSSFHSMFFVMKCDDIVVLECVTIFVSQCDERLQCSGVINSSN